MSTTTQNLQLVKPSGSDKLNAFRLPYNGNMDKIDSFIGKILDDIAEAYDSTSTYAVGDYCIHDGKLYKCITAIVTAEDFNSAHWNIVILVDEIGSGGGGGGSLVGVVADEYDSTSTYVVGAYCMHGDLLYRCNTAIVTAEAWNSAHWDNVLVVDTKADKVSGATSGDFAGLDTNGNLVDSGYEASDFVKVTDFANADIGLTITPQSWSQSAPYTYSWSDSRITANCSVDVYFPKEALDCEVNYVDFTKTTGNITFTVDQLPAHNLSLIIHLENVNAHNVASTSADMVSTSAVSGQSTVEGALSAISEKQSWAGNTSGNATFASGWTSQSGALNFLRKKTGMIYMPPQFLVVSASKSIGSWQETIVATIPVGFRPGPTNFTFFAQLTKDGDSSVNEMLRFIVHSNGNFALVTRGKSYSLTTSHIIALPSLLFYENET